MLQNMARQANSKVVFVPMQLQTDVAGQLRNAGSSQSGVGAMISEEAGNEDLAGRAGLINSVSNM
jgi:erythrocyte band 7 integral membrane protein